MTLFVLGHEKSSRAPRVELPLGTELSLNIHLRRKWSNSMQRIPSEPSASTAIGRRRNVHDPLVSEDELPYDFFSCSMEVNMLQMFILTR